MCDCESDTLCVSLRCGLLFVTCAVRCRVEARHWRQAFGYEHSQLSHLASQLNALRELATVVSICDAVRRLTQSGSHGDALWHVDYVPLCMRLANSMDELCFARDAHVVHSTLMRAARPAHFMPRSSAKAVIVGMGRSVTCEAKHGCSEAAISCPVYIYVIRYPKLARLASGSTASRRGT